MYDHSHVLLIEDQHDLASNVYEYLAVCGYIMDAAPDGVSGLALACDNEYDAIVLDLALPGMDGIDVCARLRHEARKDTPIIMLTARDTLDDKLAGFAAGADGYLVKPFDLAELAARLHALIRRARYGFRMQLQVGDLVLDTTDKSIRRAERTIHLTPTCQKILEILMQASPRAVSRERLERTLWGEELPDRSSLRAHIYVLRSAIDGDFDRQLLHTVHRYGYRLADPAFALL